MLAACRILVAASLLATIASTLSVYPHSLAYFNELAGGAENGQKHLLGSNLDWGQDLLQLVRWQRKHHAAPIRTEILEKAQVYLDGMWNGRERLRAYTVRVTETKSRDDREGEKRYEYYIAAEHDFGNVRVDTTSSAGVAQFARTGTETLIHIAGRSHPRSILRYSPDFKPPDAVRMPFDPRLIGLVQLGEFEVRMSMAEFRSFITQTDLVECMNEHDGTCRLSWTYAMHGKSGRHAGRAIREVWIDPSKGYSPVRLRVLTSPTDAPPSRSIRSRRRNGRKSRAVGFPGRRRWPAGY